MENSLLETEISSVVPIPRNSPKRRRFPNDVEDFFRLLLINSDNTSPRQFLTQFLKHKVRRQKDFLESTALWNVIWNLCLSHVEVRTNEGPFLAQGRDIQRKIHGHKDTPEKFSKHVGSLFLYHTPHYQPDEISHQPRTLRFVSRKPKSLWWRLIKHWNRDTWYTKSEPCYHARIKLEWDFNSRYRKNFLWCIISTNSSLISVDQIMHGAKTSWTVCPRMGDRRMPYEQEKHVENAVKHELGA